MLSITLYQRLQSTIQQANHSLRQYEKYTACFSIRAIDEEFGAVFRLISFSYAKLNMLIRVSDANFRDNYTMRAIDNTEVLNTDIIAFLKNIQIFLDTNRRDIINALRDHEETPDIITELYKLERQTDRAEKIVSRIKQILFGSQQVYIRNEIGRQIA